MRIIVTRHGIEVVDELDEMNKYNPLSSQSIGRKNLTSYNRKKNSLDSDNRNLYSNTYSLLNDTKRSRRNITQIDFDIENLTPNELKNAKELKLTTTKISFPKSFANNYDDNDTSSNIIDSNFQLPSLVNNKNKTENSSFLNQRYYSFRDIIPNNKITEMKLNIIKDRKMKDKLSRIDETKFRSIYHPKTELENFDDVLNCAKINPNKMGLIRYLNESKNPQPITLKDLINSNSHRLNRMNKICETLLREEERQRVMNQNIQKKIKSSLNAEIIEYQNQINSMKEKINEYKEKMEKYNIKRVDHKENYKDLYRNMENKVWAKYDFDRLNKKNSPKTKNDFNITSNEENKTQENKKNLPEID